MQAENGKPTHHSLFWKALTIFWLMLAVIGTILPLMPTTVFLLLAAWSAPKASPKLEKWLYEHPKFGPHLRAWRDEQAVTTKSKWSALILMSFSWGLLYYLYGLSFVSMMVGGIFVCVLTYLFSLPAPKQTKPDAQENL